MTNAQIKLLSRMKKLISLGKRRFEQRPDRDYMDDLMELGIVEEEAWNNIISLTCHFYFQDPKPSYYKSENLLTFKRVVNGQMAYIKLKIEKDGEEEVVCLSFHKDR